MALIVAPEEIINHRFRRGASGKKDRLDKDAGRAHALGMSYGRYKALEREGKLPANAQADPAAPTADPAAPTADPALPAPAEIMVGAIRDRRVLTDYPPKSCDNCGKTFKPHVINSKYCCDDCRRQAWQERASAAKKARKAKAKEAQA